MSNRVSVSKRALLYFCLGTEAELIKVIPVMRELIRRDIAYELIATGQNNICQSELFAVASIRRPSLIINSSPLCKTPFELLRWSIVTFFRGLFAMRRHGLGRVGRRGVLVVHGDTVTTFMGGVLGRMMGMQVAHIEAGLRSGNFLKPFPEELDRVLTSYFATIHFCPYRSAVNNLAGRKGIKVDTKFNTNIDSLAFALSMQAQSFPLPQLESQEYFIFILHRQENLLNGPLVHRLIPIIERVCTKTKCLFVGHEPTFQRLEELGLLGRISNNPNIVFSQRLPYLDFISVLEKSEFIMTDGGGNQQECYYLGKPCLILRDITESEEGLGRNVLISGNEPAVISDFIDRYKEYSYPRIIPEQRPSDIVVSALAVAIGQQDDHAG